MKLLRTIRLDASDSFIFDKAAEPGEWAVSGAFTFACGDPTKYRLLDIDVVIEPLRELHDAPFSWYLGLSSEGSRIGDAIYGGDDLDDAARARLIGLFRLTFREAVDVIEKVRGDAVYLLLATTIDELLRLKNLVAGLPIRRVEAVN